MDHKEWATLPPWEVADRFDLDYAGGIDRMRDGGAFVCRNTQRALGEYRLIRFAPIDDTTTRVDDVAVTIPPANKIATAARRAYGKENVLFEDGRVHLRDGDGWSEMSDEQVMWMLAATDYVTKCDLVWYGHPDDVEKCFAAVKVSLNDLRHLDRVCRDSVTVSK